MAHELEPLIALFRLLSDKTRMHILMILSTGERNVSSLCEELRLPQPTVSHHLGLLRENKLISNRRHGKRVFYGLSRPPGQAVGAMTFSAACYSVRIESTAST